ncbi:MAG: threonine-phosphate decarboxylase [Arthrospira sp. PLM2.Bin9]|nr:threonine-phosphate decarboxylase CobD [Arthrospira sp. PLM2.Bin9]TVU54941.1 MAG: threonine-phosphate decarboxylase [Arthrospira sp. PLM2.Bin9]
MNRPSHGGNLMWAASIADCPPSEILDFSASINPLGPPLTAIAALASHQGEIKTYPQPDYMDLRQALSRFHGDVPVEWILPGNGAAELLTWAGRELAQGSATYLLTPAFGDYRRSLNAFNARVIEFPISLEGGDNLQFDGLGELDDRAGLLLNTPHNPTGILLRPELILPLLERFALVVVDEAFMDFLPPSAQTSLIPMVADFPNLVIVRSLTKFYSLPGLRLGYAIAHPDRLNLWRQWRDPWSVNNLAVAAGIAVLGDRAFEEKTHHWLSINRPKLYQELGNIAGLYPYPGVANFLLVRSQCSVTQLQTKLLTDYRILIRDCLSFPELGDNYFRVAVRTEAENQYLITALKNILIIDN